MSTKESMQTGNKGKKKLEADGEGMEEDQRSATTRTCTNTSILEEDFSSPLLLDSSTSSSSSHPHPIEQKTTVSDLLSNEKRTALDALQQLHAKQVDHDGKEKKTTNNYYDHKNENHTAKPNLTPSHSSSYPSTNHHTDALSRYAASQQNEAMEILETKENMRLSLMRATNKSAAKSSLLSAKQSLSIDAASFSASKQRGHQNAAPMGTETIMDQEASIWSQPGAVYVEGIGSGSRSTGSNSTVGDNGPSRVQNNPSSEGRSSETGEDAHDSILLERRSGGDIEQARLGGSDNNNDDDEQQQQQQQGHHHRNSVTSSSSSLSSSHMVEAQLVVDPQETIYDAQEVKVEQARAISMAKWICSILVIVVTIVVVTVTFAGNDGSSSMQNDHSDALSIAPTVVPTMSSQQDLAEWVALGEPIHGKTSLENFGTTVVLSKDGTVLAAAASPMNGVDQPRSGRVCVFDYDSSALQWIQRGQPLDGFVVAGYAGSGDQLALSGDGTTVAISSYEANSLVGMAAVYRWKADSNQWVQQGRTLHGQEPGDRLGRAIALSNDGSVLAISASLVNPPGAVLAPGQVRMYEWDEDSKDWKSRGGSIRGVADNDMIGASLSLSCDGSMVALSAPFGVTTGKSFEEESAMGRTRVYIWSETETEWFQRGHDIPGSSVAYRAVSLSTDGRTVAISVSDPKNHDSSGSAHIYLWEEDETKWIQKGETIHKDDSDKSLFPISMSADGNSIAFPAALEDGDRVIVYDWIVDDDSTRNSWSQRGRKIHGNNAKDGFGFSVSLSGNGNVLAVGSDLKDVVVESNLSDVEEEDTVLESAGLVDVYHWPWN